jgi:hypothetical protein
MATKTDNASTFKIVAGLIAVLLIAAAGLVYLQSESAHRRRHEHWMERMAHSTSSMPV